MQSKYYAQVQYEIRNSGDAGFVAPSESVDYAACGTPAILNFLSLTIEGGRDGSGNSYPAIELSRFATCVIDDSNTADAGSCVAGGATTDFTEKPSQSFGINQGGSYGVSKTVYAKFSLTAEQFNALSNSAPSGLTFTLSVNKNISPNGAAGVVTTVDGSKLKEATWAATAQGTTVLLFKIRTPSAAPTTAPTGAPSAAPTTAPTVVPSALPTSAPTVVPSAAPTSLPTTVISAVPTSVPTTVPSAVPSASPIVCDNIIGPNLGAGTVTGYGNDQTLGRVCLTTNVQDIADKAFSNDFGANGFEGVSSISSIYMPSSVKTIGHRAFIWCSLKSVTFTGEISTIGAYAFYAIQTNQLTLAFPGGVQVINEYAFAESRLVSLSFGGTVVVILTKAFYNNYLKTVVFPVGLFRINDYAFQDNALTNVTFRGAVTIFGDNVFLNNPDLQTVYYPRSWAIPVDKFPNGVTFVPTD